ncbi:FHA domain-containing protein [Kitasatospora sp. NPDC127111]|uniref:FHA domain-containing protein n=1 Tax=Kitasatospora sp. NPDC127111 TaxID=3345363 RepID=UPI003625D22E
MPICPRGHESQAEDWCDFCGFPMTPPSPVPPPPGTLPGAPGAPGAHGAHGAHGHGAHGGSPFGGPVPPAAVPPPGPVPGPVAPAAPAAGQGFPDLTEGLVLCPICRSPQTGRFCEECGYDYDLSTPSRRQPPAAGAPVPGPVPAPPPLNIPAAYGGPQPPAPPAQPQAPQPYPQEHAQPPAPPRPAQPGAPSGYGYPPAAPAGPPYQETPFQEPAYPEPAYPQPAHPGPAQPAPAQSAPGYPEPLPREDSGPVYAQPGPTGRGGEFGTSFNLAPPVPQQPQQPQPVAPGQAAPGQGLPQPEPVRANWIAVVAADRDYFTEMMARSGPEAAGLFFPPYCPERRIPITGRGQLRIGRRSQHRGTVPEIDLSVPPEDPGASHQHALLAEQSDGSWVLVDQDSTNGTTVNGGAEPITPHTAIPLTDGDRIHIGAWTTITLHRA